MAYEHVIFDFDGTLANTFELVQPLYNSVAAGLGLRQLSVEEVALVRRLTIPQLLRRFDIPLLKLPRLLTAIRREMTSRVNDVAPIPGMREACSSLKARGVSCHLLSTASRETIDRFCQVHQFDRFEQITCDSGLLNKGKLLRRMLRAGSMGQGKAVYVGDEARDVAAARAAAIPCVTVAWGYGALDILQKASPDFIAADPQQLTSWLLDGGRVGGVVPRASSAPG